MTLEHVSSGCRPQSYWLVSVELYRIVWGVEVSIWLCICECLSSPGVLHQVSKCVRMSRENPSWLTAYRCFSPSCFFFFFTQPFCGRCKSEWKKPLLPTFTLMCCQVWFMMGGYTWLLCAHGQMTLCDLLYMGLYLFPCNTSCLFWLIWETMQHIQILKKVISLFCTKKSS